MIEQKLIALIREALESAAGELGVTSVPENIELSRPRKKEFGDFSTNVALMLAARQQRNPRDVAQIIVKHLPRSDVLTSAEVAGAGFINIHVAHALLHEVLRQVASEGGAYGRAETTGVSVQVEFVSANPTGPLHIGHARGAALGDALANVLAAAGNRVEREYYCNDAGRQMELFGRSVEARYLELHGREARVPEEGYQGEYITDIAGEIARTEGGALLDLPEEARWRAVLDRAEPLMLDAIRATLKRFGVEFQTFFSQRSLLDRGAISEVVERLRTSGHAYDQDGAVWFRATAFGDDKDRVLIRSNGEPTYFAADCAYLVDKFGRGFDHLLYVWGADHHGDVKRVQGAAAALGFDPAHVEMLIHQFVSFTRGGEQVRMSKRTGELVSLDELLDEVGKDAARYTLLARSHDAPLEFDLEEVARQSMENPVYYVQYAHARIASILRLAAAQGLELRPIGTVALELLVEESELDLLRAIAEAPEQIRTAAALRSPHRLTTYAEELAATFHRFYTECRVVSDDPELTQARLWLSSGTKQVVANVLGLIGVFAPERMERVERAEGVNA
jgi:arginyl-tRNA synthetase